MSQHTAKPLRPTQGQGKVVIGFLFYNMGLCLILDSRSPNFSLGFTALGILIFLFGWVEYFFAVRKQKQKTFSAAKTSMTTAGILLSLFLAQPLWAAKLTATQQIQEIDEMLKGYHGAKKGETLSTEQRDKNLKIKNRIVREDFDMGEMCKLALDDHWGKLSAAQQKEFVDLFTRLLINNAILHSEKHTGQEKIDYLSEDPIAQYKGRVMVKTRVEVPSESVDFDIRYAMLFDAKKGRWRVYDLLLDEESLMLNYRDQFHTIITQHNYAYLVQKMRTKLADKTGPQSPKK